MAGETPATARPSGLSIQTRRSLAKAGMAVSLGLLVATGLTVTRRTPSLRRVHLWSGVAMVGFCGWHASLYKRKPSGKQP